MPAPLPAWLVNASQAPMTEDDALMAQLGLAPQAQAPAPAYPGPVQPTPATMGMAPPKKKAPKPLAPKIPAAIPGQVVTQNLAPDALAPQTPEQQAQALIDAKGKDRAKAAIKNEDSEGNQNTKVTPAMVGDRQNMDALTAIRNYYSGESDRNLASFQQQLGGIKTMEDELARFHARPKEMDWTPLMSLVDSETGSNFAQHYKAPLSDEEKALTEMKLQQAIQTARSGISKNDVAMWKAQFPNAFDKQVATTGGKTIIETATTPTPPPKTVKVDDFTKDLTAHEKRLGSDFPALISSFEALNAMIPGGGIDKYNGADIPGAGRTGFIARKFPGLVSDAGADISKKVQNIENRITYLESGKQINEAEAARLRTALGTGAFATDNDLVMGMRNFREELGQIMRSKEIPLRNKPGAWKAWLAQGGLDSDNVFKIGRAQNDTVPTPGVKSAAALSGKAPAKAPAQNSSSKKMVSDEDFMKLSPADQDRVLKNGGYL